MPRLFVLFLDSDCGLIYESDEDTEFKAEMERRYL